MKYFRFAIIASILVYAGLYWYTGSLTLLYLAMTLTVVELAVSFDNAVVNATHIHKMNAFWRQMFLTVGILIAVIGMRFFLPLVVVAFAGGMSIVESYTMAVNDGHQFGETIKSAAISIHGFGGAFLMMVGLRYFMDLDREEIWIPIFEKPLMKFGAIQSQTKIPLDILATLALVLITALTLIPTADLQFQFIVAAGCGIGLFIVVDLIKMGLEAVDSKLANSKAKWAAGGLGTFMYLEVLDASFSFDGVIAAFAISDNLFVIAAGLGIGALFVRSMTIMLDETGTLKTFRYMEHGAFIAILCLASTMFIGAGVHVPEWVVAVTSIALIGIATFHSWRVDATEAKAV